MEIDKAVETMVENLQKNTGKSLAEWTTIVNRENLPKHGEIIKFLKEKHGLTYGFANMIAHKANNSDAGSVKNKNALIEQQYVGKEHFVEIYESLISQINTFGDDIEISPKNAYVSLRRKKQFALLQPATKTRFEIGINLKGQAPSGRLEAEKPNAMCSHKINISRLEDVDREVLNWIRLAYDKAG